MTDKEADAIYLEGLHRKAVVHEKAYRSLRLLDRVLALDMELKAKLYESLSHFMVSASALRCNELADELEDYPYLASAARPAEDSSA